MQYDMIGDIVSRHTGKYLYGEQSQIKAPPNRRKGPPHREIATIKRKTLHM